ncbi:MAG: exodeoxyribonuclease V, partial [Actinomycetota bacterium]
LEAADFAAPDPNAEFHRIVTADPRTSALGVSPELLVSGLTAVLTSPLAGLAEGRTLSGLVRGERLAELGFHLPIADGAAALPRAAFVDAAIANEPPEIAAAFAEIRDSWSGATVRGLLTGSIDALFRFDDRYYVVDYKTNRLQPPGDPATVAHYGRAGMLDAMRHHRYLLQALVYTVATHRFLATRLVGYDPERHLGGVGYLFVRGMVGAGTPVINGTACGVFAWRPTVTTILTTDEAIGGIR